ncbi:MAG: autotransporter outer membrane beta-barrel domain-containing protein, partial [Rickettsiaceae bacterium]|nr:autotransporter outer membrane beta-barrel domain-containing protein [Rickettsiaceae bacterium]
LTSTTISIGSGILTAGGTVTGSTSFTAGGTLDLGAYTHTGSVDFAGNAATISLAGGTITGSVDSTSSSNGTIVTSSGINIIKGDIGASYAVNLNIGNSAPLSLFGSNININSTTNNASSGDLVFWANNANVSGNFNSNRIGNYYGISSNSYNLDNVAITAIYMGSYNAGTLPIWNISGTSSIDVSSQIAGSNIILASNTTLTLMGTTTVNAPIKGNSSGDGTLVISPGSSNIVTLNGMIGNNNINRISNIHIDAGNIYVSENIYSDITYLSGLSSLYPANIIINGTIDFAGNNGLLEALSGITIDGSLISTGSTNASPSGIVNLGCNTTITGSLGSTNAPISTLTLATGANATISGSIISDSVSLQGKAILNATNNIMAKSLTIGNGKISMGGNISNTTGASNPTLLTFTANGRIELGTYTFYGDIDCAGFAVVIDQSKGGILTGSVLNNQNATSVIYTPISGYTINSSSGGAHYELRFDSNSSSTLTVQSSTLKILDTTNDSNLDNLSSGIGIIDLTNNTGSISIIGNIGDSYALNKIKWLDNNSIVLTNTSLRATDIEGGGAGSRIISTGIDFLAGTIGADSAITINNAATLTLHDNTTVNTTINGQSSNHGTLVINPGTSKTIDINKSIGANYNLYSTLLKTGTINLNSLNLSSDVEFNASDVTLNIKNSTITGNIDFDNQDNAIIYLEGSNVNGDIFSSPLTQNDYKGSVIVTGSSATTINTLGLNNSAIESLTVDDAASLNVGGVAYINSITLTASGAVNIDSVLNASTISVGSGLLQTGGNINSVSAGPSSISFTDNGTITSGSNGSAGIYASIDFAGNDSTVNASAIIGVVSTTAASTGNLNLEQGIYGNIGSSAHPLNSVTVSTKSDDTSHSHNLYTKTLNIGSGLGNSFVINSSKFAVDNIHINANDALIINGASTGGVIKNLTGDTGSIFITAHALESTNLSPDTLSVSTIVSTANSSINFHLNNTKSQSNLILGEDTIVDSGSITLSNNSYIFIASGKSLTATSSSTIKLGSGGYIADQIDTAALSQINTILGASAITSLSQNGGTFTSEFSGTLPQIGTNTKSLTNLILGGTSSTIHEIKGNIYALNTTIKAGPTIKLANNITIMGNVTLEDTVSINLQDKTLTIANSDLTITKTLNLAIKLTSSTQYGNISFTNPSNKINLSGAELTLTIDSSAYQLKKSDNIPILSKVQGDPSSLKIVDISHPSNKYIFASGIIAPVLTSSQTLRVATNLSAQLVEPLPKAKIATTISSISGIANNLGTQNTSITTSLTNLLNNYTSQSSGVRQFIDNITYLAENNKTQDLVDTTKRIVQSNSSVVNTNTRATTQNLFDTIKTRIIDVGLSYAGASNINTNTNLDTNRGINANTDINTNTNINTNINTNTNINRNINTNTETNINTNTNNNIDRENSDAHAKAKTRTKEIVSAGDELQELLPRDEAIANKARVKRYNDIWIQAITVDLKAGTTSSGNPFYSKLDGTIIGIDTKSEKLLVGAAAAFGQAKTKLKGAKSGDRITSAIFAMSLYGKLDITQNTYIRGAVSIALSTIKQKEKQIDILNATNYTAISKYQSQTLAGEIAIGTNYKTNNKSGIFITPELSLQQTNTSDNGYETISSYVPSYTQKRTSSRLDSAVGVNISKQFSLKMQQDILLIVPSLGIKATSMISSKEGALSKSITSTDITFLSAVSPQTKDKITLSPSIAITKGNIETVIGTNVVFSNKYRSISGSLKVKVGL